MIKVLFVCHGNICRSPMAEFILKDMVKKEGMESRFHIESRATHTDEIWDGEGSPVYPPAKKILNANGINCDGKRAELLKKSDYDAFDYLIGMDHENIRWMRRITGGDPDFKMSLLKEYSTGGGVISDPWYTRDFDTAYREIVDGCKGFFEYLKEHEN